MAFQKRFFFGIWVALAMLFDDLYSKLSLFFIFCQQGIEFLHERDSSFCGVIHNSSIISSATMKSEFNNQVSGSVARKESLIASTWKKFLALLVTNELNLLSGIVD